MAKARELFDASAIGEGNHIPSYAGYNSGTVLGFQKRLKTDVP